MHSAFMRNAALPAALALVTPVAGCVIVPMRLPARAKTPSGQVSTVDLRFLQPGVTTSAQLRKNLAAVDTGAGSPAFFWGRWETSDWGYGGFVAAPMVGGGAGGKRVWTEHNLLVTLDEKGIVKSWTMVRDKNLCSPLTLLDRSPMETVKLPAQSVVHMGTFARGTEHDAPVFYVADFVLSSDSLAYSNMRLSESRVISSSDLVRSGFGSGGRILRRNIKNIRCGEKDEEDLGYIQVHIQLKERAVVSMEKGASWKSKNLSLFVDPPTLLMLRRYVKETPAPK